jgi:Skp family chaperone for outer membrane proteins
MLLLIALVGSVSAATTTAQAQDVTKVGVCNLTQVMQATWDRTAASRDYVRIRAGIFDEFVHLDRELHYLEVQGQTGKLGKVRQYVSAYKAQRRDWMSRVSSALKLGPALAEVIGVINRVSQANGLALVVRSEGSFPLEKIVFTAPEADITDNVIDDIFKSYTDYQLTQ